MTDFSANTLGLSTMGGVHPCRSVIRVDSSDQLPDVLGALDNPLILGGGSNVLFTQPLDRDVVVIDFDGINIIEDTEKDVLVKVMAGTVWHDLVMWAVDQDYGGIENLSLIPGKCGAAPIQNIGAYGVELSDVLEVVECYHVKDEKWMLLSAERCELGYRDSVFKHALRGEVVITSITIRLTKSGHHTIRTDYGAIQSQLESDGIDTPSIKDVSQAVIAIRQSKLPDPAEIPNNGSFFKNPILTLEAYARLLTLTSDAPSYSVDGNHVKVPAGWLIDQCGWKGKQIGQVATHDKQALVIVNKGTDNGAEILAFSKQIQASVLDRFGVRLTPEVNIY